MLPSISDDATISFTLRLLYLFIMLLQIFLTSNTQSPLIFTCLYAGQLTKGIQKERYSRTSPILNLSYSRSEEHTSELQSRPHLVCRLLLEKKKKKTQIRKNSQ